MFSPAKYFSLLFFIILINDSIAQKKNDTIKVYNVTYNSEYEKKCFEDFQKNKIFSPLSFLLAMDKNTTKGVEVEIRKMITEFNEGIDKKVRSQKDVSKSIKYIFEKTHSSFFKKYDLHAYFNNIFIDGTYNCVTGSALYALILSNFEIPYSIKEKPTHVYLIADPKGKSVLVESTDPTKGYFTPDEKYKKEYVDYLVKDKLISKDELSTKGYNAIFDEYYYTDDDISFQNLIGLHYYNSCIENLRLKEYNKALAQIEKAYILYPCIKTKYMLSQCALLTSLDKDFSNLNDVDLLIKAFKYYSKEDKTPFAEEFEKITQTFLIEQNKSDHYDKIFEKFNTEISDSLFLNDIYLIYYGEKAKVEALNGSFSKSLEYAIKAYERNKENVKIKSMLAGIISEQVGIDNDYVKAIKQLDTYAAQYPFILENSYIKQRYATCYLILISSYFEANNEKEGLKYLKLFEEIADKNKEVKFNDNLIGIAYGQIWAYYVRKQRRPYAKTFIERGLKYAPFSTELQHKKRIIEEDSGK